MGAEDDHLVGFCRAADLADGVVDGDGTGEELIGTSISTRVFAGAEREARR